MWYENTRNHFLRCLGSKSAGNENIYNWNLKTKYLHQIFHSHTLCKCIMLQPWKKLESTHTGEKISLLTYCAEKSSFSMTEGIGAIIALAGLGLDLPAKGELDPEVKRGVPSSLGKGEIKDGDPSTV